MTTGQTSWWLVGVFYTLGSTCNHDNHERSLLKSKAAAEVDEASPGVMLSEGLHGGEELDAFLQSHGGLLLLRLQHALVLLVDLHKTPGITSCWHLHSLEYQDPTDH